MSILLVVATKTEIEPLLKQESFIQQTPFFYSSQNIDVLITGIGLTATAIALTMQLHQKPYLHCINAGICGAFNNNLSIGEIVHIVNDRISELGRNIPDGFLPFTENQWISPQTTLQLPLLQTIQQVQSISVNAVTSNNTDKMQIHKEFQPDVENMEGAAFFLCCNTFNIPCIQIRTVSNYVGNPSQSQWNKDLAIENLDMILNQLLQEMQSCL